MAVHRRLSAPLAISAAMTLAACAGDPPSAPSRPLATEAKLAALPASADLGTTVAELRRATARYHDVAASTKIRGQGIGFAEVGIKLGLLVSHDVVTEKDVALSSFVTQIRFTIPV